MPASPSARPTFGDLRDAAVVLAVGTILGLGSLGVRADVPWIAEVPEPTVAACVLDDDLEGWEAPSMPRIAVPELLEQLAAGHLTVVDARPVEAFARAHIPGAISLPATEAEALLGVQTLPIPPGDLVVTYCDGDGDDSASEAVGRLLGVSAGCSQVHVLEGGWSAWVASGAPVQQVDQNG
jgi:rhodanese-related sulfurtransferase